MINKDVSSIQMLLERMCFHLLQRRWQTVPGCRSSIRESSLPKF